MRRTPAVALAAFILVAALAVGAWQTQSSFGTAGVIGPGLATSTDIPTFNGTSGSVLQDPASCSLTSTILNCPTAFVHSGSTVVVGAAGFSTINNASLQAIAGLTWTLPAIAKNWSFSCDLTYSQATANTAVAFGIQAATNNPTNIYATGIEQITVGPPATFVTGTLATLATTAATSIVSGTGTALTTNYTAHLAGTIENPALANTIVVMASTAAGADAVTVLRGSFCQLY